MTPPTGAYFVTPQQGGPYRVILEAGADGWSATVERGGERWVYGLRSGPEEDCVWVGGRLVRWAWSDGRLVLDGVEHPLVVESEVRRRVGQVSAAATGARSAGEIRAPMPGLIVAVEVEEGERVERGQGVVVIEAMKMENEIVSPATGTVRGLAVTAGAAVEKNALVCRIEPDGEGPA